MWEGLGTQVWGPELGFLELTKNRCSSTSITRVPLRWRWRWGNPRTLQPAGLVHKTVNKGLYLRQGGSQRLSELSLSSTCSLWCSHALYTHTYTCLLHTYMCPLYTYMCPLHTYMCMSLHAHMCPLHTHMPPTHMFSLYMHTCPYTHRTPTHTHPTCTCAPYTHKHTSTYTHVPSVHTHMPLVHTHAPTEKHVLKNVYFKVICRIKPCSDISFYFNK